MTTTAADIASFARLARRAVEPEPVKGGEHSALAAARIRADEAAAAASGFALPPPVYAAGTRVVDLGDQNFATERQKVADLPLFADAAAEVQAQIAAERRRDRVVPLHTMRLSGEGRLYREGTDPALGAYLEPRAFTALCQRGGFGRGAAYLRDHCDPQLRAFNVVRQLMDVEPSQEALMRLRRGPQGWQTYGVVSPRYTAYDADRFLADVTPALADARAEVLYTPETCSLRADAYWTPDEIVDLAAGDVFKAGVRLRTNDDGSGSVVVEAVLFRNLCLNLIIIGKASVETVRERHVGAVERIQAAVTAGVEDARSRIAHFLAQWGRATSLAVDLEAEIGKVTEGVIEAGVPKTLDDKLQKAFALAYGKEPSATVTGVANAITRAAHEGGFAQGVRDTLEAYSADYVRKAVAVARA